MQISIENKNGLNAELRVTIHEADYNEQVKKSLSKYQKTMNVPGFRKGHVPFGVVQKMIGTDAKREQVDKILQEGIQNYLKENNVKLVLSPLSTYVSEEVNWKTPDMDFTYDIGFRPEIKPNLKSVDSLTRMKVVLLEEDIQKDIDSMRKSAGQLDMADVITDTPGLSVSLKFTELDESGNPFEGGQSKQKFYQAADMPQGIKDAIVSKDKGEKIKVDLFSILSEEEIETLLEADKMTVRDLNHTFEIEIQAAFSIKAAEMDQAFFDKYMEPGTVTNEEEFMAEWKKRVENYYQREADSMFFKEVREVLPKNTEMELPHEFLKKYYLVSYNAKTEDDVIDFEDQLAKFENELKWILIADELGEQGGINVTEEDILNFTMSSIRYEFSKSGMANPEEALVRQYAVNYLQQESNYSRTVMMLKDSAVYEYLLGIVHPKEEEVTTQKLSELKKAGGEEVEAE